MKIKIKRDEFWIIDLRKYFYDIISNSERILEKVKKENIIFYRNWDFKEDENIILIHFAWARTSAFWIREENYQIDIFCRTFVEVENLKNILISELNRKKDFWIFIKLENIAPDMETPKNNYFRRILIFSLVTKDQNF